MDQQAQNKPLKMPKSALLQSIAEAGRCLGVAQAKGDKDAIAYWSEKVDELVVQELAKPKESDMAANSKVEHMNQPVLQACDSVHGDAERWRKLRAAIYHLGRLPTKLEKLIQVTAGSNEQGLDDAVDAIKDYRQ